MDSAEVRHRTVRFRSGICDAGVSISFGCGPALSYARPVEFHVGRLVDHVHVRVRDLDASRAFYTAALGALGREVRSGEGFAACDELWISADGPPTERVHLAFQTDGEEAVQRFHAAAIAAGGRDNGAPGERSYHPGYYAAFVLDPDGNNIEAVYHGPARRSAPSVVIEPED
jgi:catechol 2,3-dioxygenase-like lactoylglutathione lyase family enzyme